MTADVAHTAFQAIHGCVAFVSLLVRREDYEVQNQSYARFVLPPWAVAYLLLALALVYPLRKLLRAGINVCLGTDSLASVYKRRLETVELNMFEEMRTVASAYPWLSARDVIDSATINGAKALGMKGQIGELSKGAFADAVALPFAGKVSEAWEAVLHHDGDVSASMIDGQWAYQEEEDNR